MALVIINRDRAIVSDEIMGQLTQALPGIVSLALDVPSNPEARLAYQDIEVRIHESHPMDANTLPLGIMIIANDYPERKENLNRRRYFIANEVRRLLLPSCLVGKNQIFVWVLLVPASFETI
jgi:hypothetical protein